MQSSRPTTPARVLFESQDEREAPGGSRFVRAARHLAADGAGTVLFLIDDGVCAAVGEQPDLAEFVEAGGSAVADSVSLAERGISLDDLAPGVVATSLDKVADLLADPAIKVVWH